MEQTKIHFDVEAGKFDGGEKNCKYCDAFDNSGDAIAAYDAVCDYPWATLEVVITGSGGKSVRYALARNYAVWRDVWCKFNSDEISWTQAFEALMSECGMPMEEALQCLAENFDRRPAIVVIEV